MSNFLRYKPGELRRRAQQCTLLGDIVFDPDADNMIDVEIITLKQYTRDQAIELTAGMRAYYPEVICDGAVADLLAVKFRFAKEFVWVTPEKITVGVNTKVVDDAAVDRALMLMIQVDDITQEQFTEFGEDISIHGS